MVGINRGCILPPYHQYSKLIYFTTNTIMLRCMMSHPAFEKEIVWARVCICQQRSLVVLKTCAFVTWNRCPLFEDLLVTSTTCNTTSAEICDCLASGERDISFLRTNHVST
ncbi:hypothetical protein Leryth_009094 [Lithospermum erythrorhizon]|nr:hypothetical protein Leryth_009094 [Lithospermum erythrorhizon]